MSKRSLIFLLTPFLALAAPLHPGAVLALGEEDLPARALSAAFEHPRRTVDAAESARLDLIVRNRGRTDETVLIEVTEAPALLRTELRAMGDEVGGVFVPAGSEKTLTLVAQPAPAPAPLTTPKTLPAGTHTFTVKVASEDGSLTQRARAQLTVREASGPEKTRAAVRVTTAYPSLRGSSEGTFKFSIDVKNETEQEDMVHLRADAPAGWRVSFKPSYENQYIASLKIEAGMSKSIEVEVDPAPEAKVGKHEITVTAGCAKGDASRKLEVDLTGKYEIACRTLDELLSLTAPQGGEAVVSMYVMNKGTAPLEDIRLSSFKPENWKVEFKPETIKVIEPGKMEQVEVKITTAGESLVGDYSVGITASAQGEGRASDDLELRVTVRASTLWGWLGVLLIISVLCGLATVFQRYGRR